MMKLPPPRLRAGKSLPESLRRRATDPRIERETAVAADALEPALGRVRRQSPQGAVRGSRQSPPRRRATRRRSISTSPSRRASIASSCAAIDWCPSSPNDLRSSWPDQPRPAERRDERRRCSFIFVVDVHRLSHTQGFQEPGLHDPEVQKSYYYVDTGLIAGNVYLFAASQGLAAWFHNCDRAAWLEAEAAPPAARSLRPERRIPRARALMR